MAVVPPAATTTDAGTVSHALFVVSVTLDPPVGAAVPKVTVHVLTPLGLNVVGEQLKEDRREEVVVNPPLADVMLRPFPFGSLPIWFNI